MSISENYWIENYFNPINEDSTWNILQMRRFENPQSIPLKKNSSTSCLLDASSKLWLVYALSPLFE